MGGSARKRERTSHNVRNARKGRSFRLEMRTTLSRTIARRSLWSHVQGVCSCPAPEAAGGPWRSRRASRW